MQFGLTQAIDGRLLPFYSKGRGWVGRCQPPTSQAIEDSTEPVARLPKGSFGVFHLFGWTILRGSQPIRVAGFT